MSATVIDGEASETDDEIEDQIVEKQIEIKQTQLKKENRPTDSKLLKRWTKAVVELSVHSQRRCQNQEKDLVKIIDQSSNCFSSLQNVAAKLNNVHSTVASLEDSVADLEEACNLLPKRYNNYDIQIHEFK